jgi:hypothetical protein
MSYKRREEALNILLRKCMKDATIIKKPTSLSTLRNTLLFYRVRVDIVVLVINKNAVFPCSISMQVFPTWKKVMDSKIISGVWNCKFSANQVNNGSFAYLVGLK